MKVPPNEKLLGSNVEILEFSVFELSFLKFLRCSTNLT